MVKLRGSGVEVDEAAVIVVMETLQHVFKTLLGILAVSDFVRACRERDFVITNASSREILINKELVERFDEDGLAVIHDAIRSITIAGTTGEGLNLGFTDPIES